MGSQSAYLITTDVIVTKAQKTIPRTERLRSRCGDQHSDDSPAGCENTYAGLCPARLAGLTSRRRKIDRRPTHDVLEPAVLGGCLHPVPRLLHRRLSPMWGARDLDLLY